ncbi:MAG: phosphoglycerate kinase [Simkaniaceae bacterium]|nr:phosphoglycerate kinase [Simkaniaceae bacterium]MCF7852295.1 phosphoglycerate kinase [Simkaniaceae bacterium]
MQKLSVQELDLKGKRVLIRTDFNVPLNPDQSIADDTRIRSSLPTIEYVIKQGGKAIILSHMGRPKKRDPHLSLSICAKRLSELLQKPVAFAPDCIGDEVKSMIAAISDGDIIVLENLRFHEAECSPEQDPSFALQLSQLGDCYVDDAFACAHRYHSSITEITKFFPDLSASGFLLERESTMLSSIFNFPKKPFFAICGGSKVTSKIKVLLKLTQDVDALFIGGAMAFAFLKAKGIDIGASIIDADSVEAAKLIIDECKNKNISLFLPEDIVVADRIADDVQPLIVASNDDFPKDMKGVDIGPKTVEKWKSHFSTAAVIFWNGPMGIFEIEPFAKGTYAIAQALADLSCTTIVGGGDSISAIKTLNIVDRFTHVSTGGGATLEYIESGFLPGVEALTNR